MISSKQFCKKTYTIKLSILVLSFVISTVIFLTEFSWQPIGFNFLFNNATLAPINKHDSFDFVQNISSVDCTSDLLTILKFNEIFSLKNVIYRRYDYALVIPDGVLFEDDSKLTPVDLCPLIEILRRNEFLISVAAGALFERPPICTLDQRSWTLHMSYNYGTIFDNGLNYFNIFLTNNILRCYSCDLLPDLFLVNLKRLEKFGNSLLKYKNLETSGHVPFFLTLKGASAYCPDLKIFQNMRKNEKIQLTNYECNSLGSRWDEHFPLIPKLTGIYRLIAPDQVREAWLGCVWIKSAKLADLPIHCSNLVRQYLFDIVDLFDSGRLGKLDYRLIYGTIIGSFRYKDVIPWSVDVDVYPLVSKDNFWDFYDNIWRKLPKLSNRTYSYSGKDGSENLDVANLEAIRAFPMCPLLLSSRPDYGSMESIFNETRNRLIGDEIVKQNSIVRTNVSKHDHWRNSGYVDVYTTSHMSACFDDPLNPNFKWTTVFGRRFKTFADAEKKLKCLYGENVIEMEPNISQRFYTWFMD